MTKDSNKVLHLIYSIVLSVLLTLLAVLFIVMCVDIYNSAPKSPFTRQSIFEHFMKIAFLAFTVIGFIVGGAVLDIVAPLDTEKPRAKVKDSLVLHRLLKKTPRLSLQVRTSIEKHHILRTVLAIISFVLLFMSTLVTCIIVLKGIDPQANMNGQAIWGMLTVVRYFAVPFAFFIVTTYICKHTVKKDLESLKSDIKNKGALSEDAVAIGTFTGLTMDLTDLGEKVSAPKKWHKYLKIGIIATVAALAIAFIILGIINGGMGDVLGKANKICTECIGMG